MSPVPASAITIADGEITIDAELPAPTRAPSRVLTLSLKDGWKVRVN